MFCTFRLSCSVGLKEETSELYFQTPQRTSADKSSKIQYYHTRQARFACTRSHTVAVPTRPTARYRCPVPGWDPVPQGIRLSPRYVRRGRATQNHHSLAAATSTRLHTHSKRISALSCEPVTSSPQIPTAQHHQHTPNQQWPALSCCSLRRLACWCRSAQRRTARLVMAMMPPPTSAKSATPAPTLPVA